MRERVCARLSIGEIDATWVYTSTNKMYRFQNGCWEVSHNVYYGVDRGWFRLATEPRALAASDGVFIEMRPEARADDPEFAAIISQYIQTEKPS